MSAVCNEDLVYPPILMSDRDWGRLKRLVERAAVLHHPVSELLETEVKRAAVYPSKDMPQDIVTMNSRVVFRAHDGADLESHVLVFPERYTPNGCCVSVTTPLGAALIGLRIGSSFPYRRPDGALVRVFVHDIAYQPEAAMRERAVRSPWKFDASDIDLLDNGFGPNGVHTPLVR